jgi:RHS repeat-associated protein
MKTIMLAVAFLISTSSLQAQNTGTGFPSFGSFTSGGFDTINNQNLNANFSIPLVSSAGRGMPLNLALTYNSLVYQNYQNTWLPAPPYGQWGWFMPSGTGYVSYTTLTTSTKCGTQWGTQTRYYNYTFTDILGTVHPVPSISIVYFCNSSWSGVFTGTATDNSGYYLDASTSHPYAKVTSPNGAQALNPLNTIADTNGNYITQTTVGLTETDWTDSVGNKAAKVIYTPNKSTPTSVQVEFLDGNGNYQTITLKFQAYSIKSNFVCSGVTEYTGTAPAYMPYEMDIPSPVSGTLTYKFSYEPTPGLSGYYTGRLQQATLPTGGYYQYTYPGANDGINCSDGTTLSMNRTVGDGTNSATWNFVRNTTNKTTTVTTPQLADTPNANASVYSFNSLGQEIQQQIFPTTATSGTALRTIQLAWATNGTPQSVTTSLEDGTTASEVYTTYDSNGLLDSMTEYDWGLQAFRTTTFTYQTSTNYTSRNILNLVTSKVTKDGSGTIQYRQDTTYDGATLSNCPTGVTQHDDVDYPCSMNYRGNPTSITTYLAPSTPAQPITKTFTYDGFGNLLTAQLNCCQSKTWTYSATTQYSQPDSITSGSSPSLTTTYNYNLYLGLTTKSTDPNGLAISYTYDFLRRPTNVSQANGSTTGQSTTFTYDDVGFKTTTKTTIDSSHAVQQIAAADGLGRTFTNTLEDASSTIYSIVQTNYDLIGRAYKTSNPYTGSPSYWTTTSLDVLGRPIKVTLQDSSNTTYTYAKNAATVTDPAGKQRRSTLDAAGRLSMVTEPDVTNGNSLTLNTTYTYTVLDALATVTTPDQSRTYTYDALGRLIGSTTPEGGLTCFGSKSGSTCNPDGYDAYDNLLTRTDARGVITSYGYDGLNRLSTVSYNVGTSGVPATPPVSLTYGLNSSCMSGHGVGCIGQLITMTDGPGSENYTYNSLEQMTQLQKVISSATYTTQYSYNLVNGLTQITYPSGRIVVQNLDSLGRLCSVGTSGSTCTSGTNYTSGYSYNTAQQLLGFSYGNGINASLGYSADRLQLQCLDYSTTSRGQTCAHDSTTKFGLSYAYGSAGSNNGQISSITDAVDGGRNATYTYDGLARLSTAATTGSTNYPAWGLQQGYDRYGNRKSQTAISGCVAPMTCPQPSVSVSLSTNRISGYTYDANGNMTNDGFNTLVYDAENRAVSASNTGSSGTYTYDGNGLRVKRVSGSTTTVYAFSGSKVIAEYDGEEGVQKEYVYSGGQLLASVGGTAISNGGFEQGLSGWSPYNGCSAVLETNSANAHSGSNYVQISAASGGICSILGSYTSVNPGDQVTFGGWANLQSGSPLDWNVGWNASVYDANYNGITSFTSSPSGSSGWIYESGTFTVPAGGAHVIIYAQVYTPSASTVLWVDDAFITVGTKYYHQDHLSNRMVTSSTGTVTEQMGHFPFGESWYNSSNDKLLFTSYERDSESGNDYAQARYYANRLGRFSGLDPLSGDISDPQTLNKYAYVRNEPTEFSDPTGMLLVNNCIPGMDISCDDGNGFDPTCGSGLFGFGFGNMSCGPNPNAGLGDPGLGPESPRGGGCPIGGCIQHSTPKPPPPPGYEDCVRALAAAGKDFAAVERAQADAALINASANANGIDPNLLAAIGVQESGWLNKSQVGGQGAGIFQIDLGKHPAEAGIAYNEPLAANYAASLLSANYNYMERRYNAGPDPTTAYAVRGYNSWQKGSIAPGAQFWATTYGIYSPLNAGTNPPLGNYVTNVLGLMNCFNLKRF